MRRIIEYAEKEQVERAPCPTALPPAAGPSRPPRRPSRGRDVPVEAKVDTGLSKKKFSEQYRREKRPSVGTEERLEQVLQTYLPKAPPAPRSKAKSTNSTPKAKAKATPERPMERESRVRSFFRDAMDGQFD